MVPKPFHHSYGVVVKHITWSGGCLPCFRQRQVRESRQLESPKCDVDAALAVSVVVYLIVLLATLCNTLPLSSLPD
jgi:hypothetical protein